ncbi:MAG: Crp/Fnr family transcriptional regulator [Planctomycetales bacterium]
MTQPVSDSILAKCPLFRGMTESERQELGGLFDAGTYAPGDVILTEGETIRRMWILLEGRCRVTKKCPSGAVHELSRLEPFGIFGEMSFFHPAPHSATVTAETAVETVCLSRARYDMLIRVGSFAAYKLAFNTMSVIIERMRKMDEWVAQKMEADSNLPEHHEEWSDFHSKLYTGWQF